MSSFRDFKYPVIILALLLLDITLVVWSCSKRKDFNTDNPTIPPGRPDGIQAPQYEFPVLASSFRDGELMAGVGALGVYKVTAGTHPLQAEIIEIRKNAAIGDPHEVDITGFMQGNPCGDCFKISGVDYTQDEVLNVHFEIRHPFGLPENNPPAMNERLDLHIFDLAGILFLPDGSTGTTTYPDLTANVSLSNSGMLSTDNSGFWAVEEWDGFTANFDTQIDKFYPTSSNLHPYKIFSLDSSRGNVSAYTENGFSDIRNPSGHNIFPQASVVNTSLKFRVAPGESVQFYIALTAAYGQSSSGKGNLPGQRGNPRYFIPEFNRKNAWRARVTVPEETDLLNANDPLSSTVLMIEVWDWQHNYGYPTDDIDPLTSRLDSLRYSSRVVSCVADIPGVNEIDITNTSLRGDGFNDTPLVYSIEVRNDKSADEGNYHGLVGIVDEMHGTEIDLYGIEKDGLTAFGVSDFITYVPFMVSVIDRSGESFGSSKSMSSLGDDSGHEGVIPDASDGICLAAHADNVYVVYSAFKTDSGELWDVFLRKSEDGGVTWSEANRLNQNLAGSQRYPTIEVNPLNGHVYVAYVDLSGTLSGALKSDVILIKSTDEGKSFTEPLIVNTSRGGDQDQVTICIDDKGAVFAAWRHRIDSSASFVAWSVSSDGIHFNTEKFINPYQSFATPSFYSNPVLVTDKSMKSTNAGKVYLVYRKASALLPDIMCMSYQNGVFANSSFVSNELTGESSNPHIVADQFGNLYASYVDRSVTPGALKVAKSCDGGLTWAHTKSLNYSIGGSSPGKPVMIVRDNNFVYLFWDDIVGGDQDIYMIRSTNGETYTKPVKISHDYTGQVQDYVSSCVNQKDDLFVLWRDCRLSEYGELYFAKTGE
jgi:hypothetical protein